MNIIVFVLPRAGEYIAGWVPAGVKGPDEFGLIELNDPVFTSRTGDQLQFLPVDAVKSLVCHVQHYLGFGDADDIMRGHYESWLAYRQKPQSFAVEEPESSET